MLVVHLDILAQVSSHMHLHLESSIDGWQLTGFTGALMSKFAPHLAGLRAVVSMLTVVAVLEGRHVSAAVKALIQCRSPIFAYHYFVLFKDQRSQLTVVFEDNLEILHIVHISPIQSKFVSEDCSLNECFDLVLIFHWGQ
jgi:hypothetical protein